VIRTRHTSTLSLSLSLTHTHTHTQTFTIVITLKRSRLENKNLRLNFARIYNIIQTVKKVSQFNWINRPHLGHDNLKNSVYISAGAAHSSQHDKRTLLRQKTYERPQCACVSLARWKICALKLPSCRLMCRFIMIRRYVVDDRRTTRNIIKIKWSE